MCEIVSTSRVHIVHGNEEYCLSITYFKLVDLFQGDESPAVNRKIFYKSSGISSRIGRVIVDARLG